MDRLRVRFFSTPFQLIQPHRHEQNGLLTFEVSEFLSLLGMAEVFRALLHPEEQKLVYEVLKIEDAGEEQFYWGRLQGILTPEAKDMLSAWRIRRWPMNQVKLLYELIDYVVFPKFD